MTDNLLKQVSKEEYDELKDLVVAMGKALENTREYCWNLGNKNFKAKNLKTTQTHHKTHPFRPKETDLGESQDLFLKNNLKDKSIEEKLASVGLTLRQVMTYAYKQSQKEIDQSFNPGDDSMKRYIAFKKRK